MFNWLKRKLGIHTHEWDKWTRLGRRRWVGSTDTACFVYIRTCKNCGIPETRDVYL